jgi:hypothetical protein
MVTSEIHRLENIKRKMAKQLSPFRHFTNLYLPRWHLLNDRTCLRFYHLKGLSPTNLPNYLVFRGIFCKAK